MVEQVVAQARHFSECRVFAYKGTREAKLRNSYHIYNPSKPPLKGGLWQVFHLLKALGVLRI